MCTPVVSLVRCRCSPPVYRPQSGNAPEQEYPDRRARTQGRRSSVGGDVTIAGEQRAPPAHPERTRMTLEATDATTTDTITVLDPVDGTVASTTRKATAAEVAAAVARARDAFPVWSRTAPADRGALLRTAAEHLREHAQELADLNTR
jgi:delta 1-pyrroline-5-carboxylate dehydrogenase